MTHANAPLTPVGRLRLARAVVDRGWTVRLAAERFQVSPTTAAKWAARYRAGASMQDASSRPHRSPHRCSQHLERRIVTLRYLRRWGPHRIAYHLGVPRSTVGRVLIRYRMPLLAHIDQVTGLPVRKLRPVRYEAAAPGDLVHIDIKKQGRIPDGGGHRTLGPKDGKHNKIKSKGVGYEYRHHAVDDHSRFVYSEILGDERKETAAAFWKRANAAFAAMGITVKAVMTDNGSCYQSKAFAQALGTQIRHIRTRPYRPQTNGKVERFNRTSDQEWAYAQHYPTNQARAAAYPHWLHHYNHHRPHTGIAGLVPADRIHNLPGNYT